MCCASFAFIVNLKEYCVAVEDTVITTKIWHKEREREEQTRREGDSSRCSFVELSVDFGYRLQKKIVKGIN